MKYRAIGKASELVYETLGSACTKHSEHLAHFCMEAEHSLIEETSTPQVKFRMAYTHQSLATSNMNGHPTWFVIDSIIAESAQKTRDDSSFQILAQSLKRSLDSVPEEPPKKAKKCVRFARPSPPIQKPSTPELCPTKLSVSVPRMRQDFCDFLRICKLRPLQADVCLGLIENPGRCKHRIYAPPCSAEFTNQRAMPLSQLISDISQTRVMGQVSTIPLYERLRLAKSLATAVLQYQSTPWLKLTWRSEDIFFFDRGKASTPLAKISNLSAPHVNVRVKGPDGALSQVSTFPPQSLAPNPLLFSLGIVLIEIAYSSPLRHLQKPADLENGQENQYTEFFAAKRLADSVARETCIPYSKIVKKLLQCDFGCGDDLSDHQLQAGFYRDVVCELDKLEKGFRSLHLGS